MSSRPASIVDLVRDGVLDTELAALLWMLLETRLPVIVVGPRGAGRSTLVGALLDLLPAGTRPIPVGGAEEDFEWLPEATELGWRRERPIPSAGAGARRASSADTVLLVAGLGDAAPGGTSGPRARVAVRALALGYGMVATMTGAGLEDVLATLRAAPVAADPDELARLGCVLAVAVVPDPDLGPRSRRRVVAAHYVRPVVRDAHGHVQRLPPAVLAAYEPRTDRLEHFAWGVVGELADRTGLAPVAFELEQARRASYLADLVSAGTIDADAVRAAIAGYHRAAGGDPA